MKPLGLTLVNFPPVTSPLTLGFQWPDSVNVKDQCEVLGSLNYINITMGPPPPNAGITNHMLYTTLPAWTPINIPSLIRANYSHVAMVTAGVRGTQRVVVCTGRSGQCSGTGGGAL